MLEIEPIEVQYFFVDCGETSCDETDYNRKTWLFYKDLYVIEPEKT